MADPASVSPSRPPIFTATVITLGLVSLLTDVAADMVTPYLGLFLTRELGASAAALGLLEGAANSLSAVMKYASGWLSDRLPRRKPIVVGGYTLANLVRPLMSLAGAPWQVFAIRLTDRVGKGLRTSPRDSLLATAVRPEDRATAFGFHRAMDNLGAVIGPLVAIALLRLRPDNLRFVFACTLVPGLLALVVLMAGVKEFEVAPPSTKPTGDAAPIAFSPAFQGYLQWVAVFTLADASDTFLMLRAADLGVPLSQIPLFWGGLSLLRALTTTPGGRLADKIGRARAVQLGWSLYALSYVGFALSTKPWHLGLALVVYGLYYGLTEGTERALVASLAPPDGLGRAYGRFNLVLGVLSLPASWLFGMLYRIDHGRSAFLTGAMLSLIAAVGLHRWRRRHAMLDGL